MDEIETVNGPSADEHTPAIEAITPVGDFHSARKRARSDLAQSTRNTQKDVLIADDEVVLSDIAHVTLLEEEGKSVSAIATDLGLTPAAVLTDLGIAAEIRHPPELGTAVDHKPSQNTFSSY